MQVSLFDVIALGPHLVGATLLWAGAIKAAEPHLFRAHLTSLAWIPQRFIQAAVSASAGLETGLGMALLLGTAPRLLFPVTVATLLMLSVVSWWGVRSGRTSDCGCYGGYVQPSIGQSLALNGLYVTLVFLGWIILEGSPGFALWQLATPTATLLGVGIFTEIAQRHAAKTGKPLFDLNPLKAGKRWRHSWAGGLTSKIDGEVLVAFLGPDCPYCSSFVKVGNAMVQSPRLPRVVGVVGSSKERLETFRLEKGISFPMAGISQSVVNRLVNAVPTAVLVESGRIKRVWVGNMPPDFVDRFKDAFFPGLSATSAERDSNGPLAAKP